MAGIDLRSIKRVTKTNKTLHAKVQTTYSAFVSNGKKYIQFDMFGSEYREYPDKVSQTIQIDEETALFLTNLFIEEYNFIIN